MRVVGLAALPIVVLLVVPRAAMNGGAISEALSTDATACAGAAWSPLREQPWLHVETWFASLADAHGTFVAADDVVAANRGVADRVPLAVFNLTTRKRLNPPADGHLFVYPIVAGGDGGLQLLWGEVADDERSRLATWPPPVTELWWSRLGTNGRWSKATRIFSAKSIYWQPTTTDRASGDAKHPALITVPVIDDAGSGVLLIRIGRVSAEATVLRVDGGLAYSAIGRNVDDHMLVAFVGAKRGSGEDHNSVFTMQSSDGGRRWNEASLISRSGRRFASQVRVIAGGRGQWDLVWLQNITDGERPEVLRHVSSTDDGNNWSIPDDLKIPDLITMLRVGRDECGDIHAILEEHPNGHSQGSRILDATWSRDQWSALREPFPGRVLLDPALLRSQDGRLSLYANLFEKPTGAQRWARPVISKLTQRAR